MARPRPGFSLLELLLAIVIMFTLITIAIVAFSGVRAGADRTASLNALRQMATGFTAYTNEHRGRFMPGNVAVTSIDDPDEFNLVGTYPGGAKVDGRDPDAADIRSWVWRLSPYVDNGWQTFYEDYREPPLVATLTRLVDAGQFGPATVTGTNLPVSEIPSFGMNSIFIGGDSAHGGAGITSRNPWQPLSPSNVLAATRLTDVKNPSRVILFGASQRQPGVGPSGSAYNVEFGSPELRAPLINRDSAGVWTLDQWHLDNEQVIFDGDFSAGGGAPIARHGGDLVPLCMVDGSAETVSLLQLNGRGDSNGDGTLDQGTDALMSRWSPQVLPPVAQQSN